MHPVDGSVVSIGAEYLSAPTLAQYFRVYCHLLVERIPDDGLSEASDQLKTVVSYYQDKANFTPKLPLSHTLHAETGTITIRAPIYISEE